LAQHDLKRLLAYHSVENIGIITMGIGAGLLGTSLGCPALAVLGWAGGLLHVLNHAVFKGLLFLGGGAAVRAAGSREMDRLGGLLRKMPWTGGCFLVGAAAISGLPPLNGFVSEFLIFLGLLGGFALGGAAGPWLVAAVGSLALIAGLAAACFCKAFGIVFLGSARSNGAANAREAEIPTRASLAMLAAICALAGIFPGQVLRAGAGIVRGVVPLPGETVAAALEAAGKSLACVSFVALGFLGVAAVLGGVLWRLRRRRGAVQTVTWDCGYAFPSPRMQYTASSFAQPVLAFFGSVLRLRKSSSAAAGFFPEHASFRTEMPDPFREEVYRPLLVRLK
jgi:formate hydrogenlyase subunit 3/multisubunit Na+/H+ antiporter MnhD subunit